MKEYIKPEAELIVFESEEITAPIGFEHGDKSNTLSDEWF